VTVKATPVVIGSHPDSPWLNDCLKTIPTDRPVEVHRTGGYEIAALRTGILHFDRFLFLQDSCEVLDPAFWNIIDNTTPTWLFGGPPMYLGVYHRNDLEQAIGDAPQVMDKAGSIAWEGALPKRLNYGCLWPEVSDATGRHEDRNGRLNLVLENNLLRKWKGSWGQP
jgi:hypothetical protein